MLEQGPTEQKILEQAYRMGMPIPDKIQNAPELWPGLDLYYKAWVDLDSTRSIGMSVGPIPWNAIENYCAALELSPEQRDTMHRLVRAMDRTYLDFQNKGRK